MSRHRLIIERDVVRAQRAKETSIIADGAVITPAARDAASKFGITLVTGSPPAATQGQSPARVSAAPTAQSTTTRIVIGADHGGVAMKDAILAYARDRGATVTDVGTYGTDAVDYPDFAVAVARAVAARDADVGIMVDGAGIGSCMAANKVAGVRAAMCYDVTTASNAREHNNANVLTLGGTLIGTRLALEIVRTFLDTPFAGGRHAKRVEKIDALDQGGGRRG